MCSAADKATVEVCAGVIFDDVGRVLVCSRPAGKSQAGGMEFPGGKVEKNESLQACIERELLEELSIHVRGGEVLFETFWTYPEKRVHLHFIRAERLDETEKLVCNDGQKFLWMRVSELKNVGLLPADYAFAEFLSKNFNI